MTYLKGQVGLCMDFLFTSHFVKQFKKKTDNESHTWRPHKGNMYTCLYLLLRFRLLFILWLKQLKALRHSHKFYLKGTTLFHVRSFVRPSIYPSVNLSVHPSSHLPTHPFIYPSTHPHQKACILIRFFFWGGGCSDKIVSFDLVLDHTILITSLCKSDSREKKKLELHITSQTQSICAVKRFQTVHLHIFSTDNTLQVTVIKYILCKNGCKM